MKGIIFNALLFLLLSCNDNQAQNRVLEYQYDFCYSSLIFPENDTNVVIININEDSVINEMGMKDIFSCIEKEISKDDFLKKHFASRSSTILLSLSAWNVGHINYELIHYADSSTHWEGLQKDEVFWNKEFLNFIQKSGYKNKWEKNLNAILGKNTEWEYYTERVMKIKKDDLKERNQDKFSKTIYPIAFELILKRK